MDDKVVAILDRYGRQEHQLVSILQDVQTELNYLPKEALVDVAEGLSIPLGQVYSVATFFRAFSLNPKGRHQFHVCMGTACHVRGASRVLESLERELCICSGDTTDDMEYSIDTVNCVGSCALGPVVVTDGEPVGQMRADKVGDLLKKFK